MAISSCEFVCKNEECKYKGSGVVIIAPWPLGEIDRVIGSQKAAKNPIFKKEIEGMKGKGRKYVCIQLPDNENIPIVGYRVNMWCEKCPCLWAYDAMIPENPSSTELMKEAIDNAHIPENCPTCNHKLKNFSELIEKEGDGVQCTFCHTRLQANVSFSNETGSDKLNPVMRMIPKNKE